MCSCPSRTDEPYEGEGYNQSPNHLAADLTTNQDLNGIANAREMRNPDVRTIGSSSQALEDEANTAPDMPPTSAVLGGRKSDDGPYPSIDRLDGAGRDAHGKEAAVEVAPVTSGSGPPPSGGSHRQESSFRAARLKQVLLNYAQFIGPGFMIAVAYSKRPCWQPLTWHLRSSLARD
jgi:metal iron transporter